MRETVQGIQRYASLYSLRLYICKSGYQASVVSGTGFHRFFAATGFNMAGLCSNVTQHGSSRWTGTGLCQHVRSGGHHIVMPLGAEGTSSSDRKKKCLIASNPRAFCSRPLTYMCEHSVPKARVVASSATPPFVSGSQRDRHATAPRAVPLQNIWCHWS